MAKAKSKKSCGLDPICHVKQAVDKAKAFMKDASASRHKTIQKVVEGAESGTGHGS